MGADFGIALNERAAQGAFRAPLLLGCGNASTENAGTSTLEPKVVSGDISTTAEFNQLLASLNTPARAASIAIKHRGRRASSPPDLAIVADGRPAVARRIKRLFSAEQNPE
jgi:urocanate hydratase